MAKITEYPEFARLMSLLNNTRVQTQNPALWQFLQTFLNYAKQGDQVSEDRIEEKSKLTEALQQAIDEIKNTSVLTADDETEIFSLSRQVLAGTGIAFDDTVSGVRVISATGTVVAGPPRVVREIPTGVLDGVNTNFTLAYTPIANTEEVYLNGLLQDARVIDYSISGAVITFLLPPVSTDYILVSYQRN